MIVRVNDWVPEVRNAAQKSLEKLLKPENAEAFVYNLPDFYHLQNCGRDNHNILIDKVISFLLKPENNFYIKSAIKNDDFYLARIAVKLCIQHSLIDKYELVSESLYHNDVVVRNIVSNLLRDFTGESLELLLKKAIKDTFMPIRREACQIYLKVFPEQGLAKKFIFDRHISIREISIKYLDKIDVEIMLNNILSSTGSSALKIRCAILGLAEIGANVSVPTIIKYSRNQLPSIRKASLQALVKLVGEEAKPYLLNGLSDKSPSVAKESARLLKQLQIILSAEVLFNIVEKTNLSHTLIVCISVSKSINKWERLIFLLSLLKLPMLKDSSNLIRLENSLYQWDLNFNRSSSQASRTQIEQLSYEYSQSKQFLSEIGLSSFDFTMKTLGIN